MNCAQYTMFKCCFEGNRKREIGPHHSRKETNDNASSSGITHKKTLILLPRQVLGRIVAGVLVNGHTITSTTSKRSVARESAAGAAKMSDTDGQKTALSEMVRRGYSSSCSRVHYA